MNFRADQPDLAERVAFVVGEGVRLVSFAGAPTKDAVARCHEAAGDRQGALSMLARRPLDAVYGPRFLAGML